MYTDSIIQKQNLLQIRNDIFYSFFFLRFLYFQSKVFGTFRSDNGNINRFFHFISEKNITTVKFKNFFTDY